MYSGNVIGAEGARVLEIHGLGTVAMAVRAQVHVFEVVREWGLFSRVAAVTKH